MKIDKKRNMYDLIIIGGGVAGLFLAANLPKAKVLLLDHANSLGKKLLITGGGAANITNDLEPRELLTHFPSKAMQNFLTPSLLTFTGNDLMKWFEDRGVSLTIREDGHVFPASLSARTILSNLLAHSKAEMMINCQVLKITKEEDAFSVETNETTFTARLVCLATGGMSYPTTGSDGSGYTLAKALGHPIVSPKPALVPLLTAEKTAHLSGISLRTIPITALGTTTVGDLLFTHDGLSGPGILNRSRDLKKGDKLSIQLIEPHLLEERLLTLPKKQLSTIIKELEIPTMLAQEICNRANLDHTRKGGTLRKEERKLLCSIAGGLSFTVTATKGFKAAMVTSGGVELAGVNRKTMESRITPNLFFCGEILDYDGESGGFNIQAACSTAYLAAQTIGERI